MLPDDEPSFAGSRPEGGTARKTSNGADSGDGVFDPIAAHYEREQRWDELVAVLIERAESAETAAARAAALVKAAVIFEAKLEDLEKAFLILQTAFLEDPAGEEGSRELARLTTALDRWPAVIADLRAQVPQLPAEARIPLLVALARLQDRNVHDPSGAEASLGEALALAPSAVAVLEPLAELVGRRGDHAGAVEHLVRAAEGAESASEKVRLHLQAAAVLRNGLGEPLRAAEQYRRALTLDPGNAAATVGLAELSEETGEALAVPLLHDVVGQVEAEVPRPGAAEDARRLLAEGKELEVAGDAEGAREIYRQALSLDPDSLLVLSAWAALAFEQRSWEEARNLHEQLLARPEAELTSAEKTDLVERLGRSCLALGDAAAAAGVLAQGLAIIPEHAGCREAIIQAYSRLGDSAAVAHHERAAIELLGAEEDRFDRLAALGRHLRDEVKDPSAALKAFVDALELRPDDRLVLDEVLELLTTAKSWKRAVPILEAIAALEEGKTRARYLVAAGNILNYELHAADEAVEVYNRALDDDPDDLKTFERIDKILTAKRAWRDEARNFRRMIKRLGPTPGPEKRPTALMLWKGLAEIYRTRAVDLPAAAAAYEVCASLEPDDLSYQEILAELFERQGTPAVVQAAEKRALLLERAVSSEEMAKQLRALLRVFIERRQPDRVWCVCAALVAYGAASDNERAAYERHAGRPFARPRAGLNEDVWQRVIYHPSEDRRICQVLAAVSPSVALVRAKEAKAWALDERKRIDPATDPSLVARLVAYASGVLGVAAPALYVHPEVPGEIDLANVIDHGHLVPTFVVGGDLLRGRSDRDVAFTIAKKLSLLRFDHFLLWPNVVASQAELRILLYAVLKTFQPSLDAPDQDQPAFKQYVTLIQRTLPPQMLEPLMAVVPPLLEQGRSIDVAGWAAAVDQTANRAALLVCGDLLTAIRRIAEDARGQPTPPDEAVRSLVRWSVSLEYLTLREQLGLAIEG